MKVKRRRRRSTETFGIQRDNGEYGRSGEGLLFAVLGGTARSVRRE
jgi:hypothetical protein